MVDVCLVSQQFILNNLWHTELIVQCRPSCSKTNLLFCLKSIEFIINFFLKNFSLNPADCTSHCNPVITLLCCLVRILCIGDMTNFLYSFRTSPQNRYFWKPLIKCLWSHSVPAFINSAKCHQIQGIIHFLTIDRVS